ncbi:hypothetical protein Rhopal_004062-T1 [Rhodotorula paludigena]|uniref:Uncharacterized protein n=1 Tax=Rhodotorula paludigena TaxID=86838 RepID=A0AAV5GNV0_9BASI|nr:hypothetical protein Rhopal_004062-T1 [Rhodotorula paludigena]
MTAQRQITPLEGCSRSYNYDWHLTDRLLATTGTRTHSYPAEVPGRGSLTLTVSHSGACFVLTWIPGPGLKALSPSAWPAAELWWLDADGEAHSIAQLQAMPARLSFITPSIIRAGPSLTGEDVEPGNETALSSAGYYRGLFASDFAESTKLTHSAREAQAEELCVVTSSYVRDYEDSDDEADAELEAPLAVLPPHPELVYYELDASAYAYTTYRALLLWVHTQHCPFAPLKSSLVADSSEDEVEFVQSAGVTSKQASLRKWRAENLGAPFPASPKSIYRLAHFLDIPSLRRKALEAIEDQLTATSCALELFSDVCASYDEVRELVVGYARDDWHLVSATDAFKGVLERFRRGELSMSGPAAAELLPMLMQRH